MTVYSFRLSLKHNFAIKKTNQNQKFVKVEKTTVPSDLYERHATYDNNQLL